MEYGRCGSEERRGCDRCLFIAFLRKDRGFQAPFTHPRPSGAIEAVGTYAPACAVKFLTSGEGYVYR